VSYFGTGPIHYFLSVAALPAVWRGDRAGHRRLDRQPRTIADSGRAPLGPAPR
jgi:hypothetical protein